MVMDVHMAGSCTQSIHDSLHVYMHQKKKIALEIAAKIRSVNGLSENLILRNFYLFYEIVKKYKFPFKAHELTGQLDRSQGLKLTPYLFLTGQRPLTGRYFKPRICSTQYYSITLSLIL